MLPDISGHGMIRMVNVIVLIKQMLDLEQVRIDPSSNVPNRKGVPTKLETLSENSIEAAVTLKEKYGGKVTAILLGNEQSSASMKRAYAMGVDDGYIITGYKEDNYLFSARALTEKIKEIPHDIVILGNQSADTFSGFLPGQLSSLLGEPLLGNAVSIDIDNGNVKVKRNLENSSLAVSAKGPVIVSVSQEINEPRLPPVMQIMAAGRKPIHTEQSKIQPPGSVEIISEVSPKSDRKRIVYEDVDKGVAEVSKILKEAIR